MGFQDVIKSYLVSLGYEVDAPALERFTNSLRSVERKITSHTSLISGTLVKAGVAYTSVIGTLATSTAILLKSIAEQDMAYQKQALALHMAKNAAKEYSTAMKVLGESPEMVAWLPELRERYRKLREDSEKLELPKEYDVMMRRIRDVNFEFARLKQNSLYFLQWIGFSISKHLLNPIEKARFTFEEFNNRLIKEMPKIADKVGLVLVGVGEMFVNLGKTFVLAGKGIKSFWDSLSLPMKVAVGFGFLAFLFSKVGPFGKVMIALGAMTALADQFWGAMTGKKTVISLEIIWGLVMALDTLGRTMLSVMVIAKGFWESFQSPTAKLAKEQIAEVTYKTGLKGYAKVVNETRNRLLKEGKTEYEIAQYIATQPSMKAQRKRLAELKKNWDEAVRATNTSNYSVVEKTMADVAEIWTPGSKKYPGVLGRLYGESRGKFFWGEEQRNTELERKIKEGIDAATGKGKPTAVFNALQKYTDIIAEASERFGVPEELIAGIIMQESSGKGRPGPTVNVGKGFEKAQGLMQLLPSSFGGKLITDDYENIMTGTQYLSQLMKKKGNIAEALAAYGGFKTKDATEYIQSVLGYAQQYKQGLVTVRNGDTNITIKADVVVNDATRTGEKVVDEVMKSISKKEVWSLLINGVTPQTWSAPVTPATQGG